MTYTYDMTVLDDDGDEAFSSHMQFATIDLLEQFLFGGPDAAGNDPANADVQITLGMFGKMGEEPSAEDIDRMQRLQNRIPCVANN